MQTTTAHGVRCLLFVEIGSEKLVAAAGNAPALPVSETGVRLHTQRQMVAREGAALRFWCRPD